MSLQKHFQDTDDQENRKHNKNAKHGRKRVPVPEKNKHRDLFGKISNRNLSPEDYDDLNDEL